MEDAKGKTPQDLELTPSSLNEFVGQKQIVNNLRVFIDSAKKRGEVLDHILLYGPPGLGKTTLAKLIAKEMGKDIKITSAPSIEKTGELVALLTSLKNGDFLFIDEIHRLKPNLEEILYSAMEEFVVDVVIGKGIMAKNIRLTLPKFTLIGATTRIGLLTKPLLSRFGIVLRFDYYSPEDMKTIISANLKKLGLEISPEGIEEIAKRSRGTPRYCNFLLKRLRDFAIVHSKKELTKEDVERFLIEMGVDEEGLDEVDRKILYTIVEKFQGGPVGLKTLATAIGEDPRTIEEVYEPFLVQQGFLKKTNRGRVITEKALKHLKINNSQQQLFKQL